MKRKLIWSGLLLLAGSVCFADEPMFGRLFTAPNERTKMVHTHQIDGDPEWMKINGYVIKNPESHTNSVKTAWVNGQLESVGRGSNLQITQKPGQRPQITVQTESGKWVGAQVGDEVNLQSSTVNRLLDSDRTNEAGKR